MIFKSLVWIAIVVGGSAADNLNQVVLDDFKLIKAAVKVDEFVLENFHIQVIEPSPKINLTKFHPPAELLPKSGDSVALLLKCGPGKAGNLTQFERQGDLKFHREPYSRFSFWFPIILNNVYIKLPECRLFWNGELIFKESVKIKFKQVMDLGYTAKLSRNMKNCSFYRSAYVDPMDDPVIIEAEVHAYKKDGTSDPMVAYLINHLLNAGEEDVIIHQTLRVQLVKAVESAFQDALLFTKNKEICHKMITLVAKL